MSSTSTTAEWDGAAYHRVSAPQLAWGEAVLARLPLAGDERIVDAGCGSGRLTLRVLERLPRGSVVGLDRSRNMLAEAARRAPHGAGSRLAWVNADLVALPFDGSFDVVFSTATFHWIHDHDALFASLRRALRPGGRICAQCGGAGNLARVHARADRLRRDPSFAARFEHFQEPWNFATPADTALRLERAGFADIETGLEDAPTPFADRSSLGAFLETVVLRPFLAHLDEESLRRDFVARIVKDLAADEPPLTLDYVRLNIRAEKPGRS